DVCSSDLDAFGAAEGASVRIDIGAQLRLGAQRRVDGRYRSLPARAILLHDSQQQVFFLRKVVMDAGRLDADYRGQVAVAEAVTAALLNQALGKLQDLCAGRFGLHDRDTK